MRVILLFVGVVLFASCGKSKGEQLLYDYQKENVKKGLNMDLEDLAFEIHEVDEVEKITAADSARIYKERLGVLWFGDDAKKEQIDTLTYDFVLAELDTLKKHYQSIILSNITLGREYENYDWKDKRDETTEAYFAVLEWDLLNSGYVKKPDSVLSVKYLAKYSINNPMLNNSKQTFDKYFYTDSENTKFIKEEMVSK